MKLVIVLVLLCSSIWGAAPVISQGPWVDHITRSTALFGWVTDVASYSKVKWGTSTGSLTNTSEVETNLLVHSWYAGGMPANTLIYYQVCSRNGDGETCSTEATFTTAAAGATEPTPAVPVDSPITPTGTVHTVDADCDDPTNGLVAKWTAAAWGDIVEIDPAVTAKCDGHYAFPAKTADTATPHRYILTRVKDAATNLGTTRVAAADKPNMARFVHSSPNVILVGTADPTSASCFAGSYRWRQGQSNAWALYRCNNQAAKNIEAIPSSGNLDITVTSHGYTDDHMVHIEGVTGDGAAAVNGDWYIDAIDADTIRLRAYIGSTVQTATAASTGGTIQLNQFELESVTEGETLPATCTYGAWWHKGAAYGTETEYERTWYCNATNEWMRYRMDANYSTVPAPVIDLLTNKAHHVIFQGLSFEPLALKADAQRAQYMYLPANTTGGTLFWGFATQSRYNHHIYWDQILAICPDPSTTGSMVRCHGFIEKFDGAHISMKRSHLAGFQVFHSKQDLDDGSSVVLAVAHGPGPHEIVDNYIDCAGICVYWHDEMATVSTASDMTLKRNHIETPDKYWDQHASWIGAAFTPDLYWSQRHRFEAKRLHRGVIEGNTFKGGWVWNNNASAVCLCTRGGVYGVQLDSLDNDTVVLFDASLSYDWGAPDLQAGDKVYFSYLAGGTCSYEGPRPTVYTVATVTDSTHFTVTPSLECTAGSGYVARFMNDTANITDVSVRNNKFESNPSGVHMLGHDSYAGPPNGLVAKTMQRVDISNNLMTDLDGERVGQGTYSANPSLAPSGKAVVSICSLEDLTVSHNTVYQRTVGGFIEMDTSVCAGVPSSGLTMKANIFEYVGSSGIDAQNLHGTAALDSAWKSGASTAWSAPYNVILRSGGSTTGYPTNTWWYDTTGDPFPFASTATGDYSLTAGYRVSDTCSSVPGDCTNDHRDIGIWQRAVTAAANTVRCAGGRSCVAAVPDFPTANLLARWDLTGVASDAQSIAAEDSASYDLRVGDTTGVDTTDPSMGTDGITFTPAQGDVVSALAYGTSLNLTSGGTWMAVAYLPAAGSLGRILTHSRSYSGWWGGDAGVILYSVGQAADGKIRVNSMTSAGPNTPYVIDSSSAVAAGWHSVAGRYDGSALTVWVDGVQVGSVAMSGSISTDVEAAHRVAIGNRSAFSPDTTPVCGDAPAKCKGDGFASKIAYAAVWSVPLPDQLMLDAHNNLKSVLASAGVTLP